MSVTIVINAEACDHRERILRDTHVADPAYERAITEYDRRGGIRMVKRKCGTCRHFKDGGIAGSGWCLHPARRELNHMVLVRKSELGCRNNWDQDLWEPAPGFGGEPDTPGDHIPTPPQIDSPLSAGTVAAPVGEMFTDRLTSITMAAPRAAATADGALGSDSIANPVERSDVRAARRRRVEQLERDREQHQRERSDEARKLVEDTPGSKAMQKPPVTESRPVTPSIQPQRAIPEPRPQPQRPIVTRPSMPMPAPAPSSVSSERMVRHTESVIPQAVPSANKLPRDESVSFGASPSSFGSPRVAPQVAPVERRAADPPRPARTHQHQDTDELPIAEVRAQQQAQPANQGHRSGVPTSPPVVATNRGISPEADPPIDERDPRWLVWAGQIDGDRSSASPAAAGGQPGAELQEILPVAMPADPVDSATRTRNIPHCCATCRDFRPIGSGTTGWCANPHAFDSRRMVESGDLACRSSIGSWWLPNDDVWLDHADTTYHSRPTPLLDELRKPEIERERESPLYPD